MAELIMTWCKVISYDIQPRFNLYRYIAKSYAAMEKKLCPKAPTFNHIRRMMRMRNVNDENR